MACGLLLAVIAGLLMRLVAWRPPSRKQKLLAEITSLRNLDPATRLAGLARILKRVHPGAIDGLNEALYQRQSALSPEIVEERLVNVIAAAKI